MAGYGYAYRSVSTYSTTRTGSGDPAVIKQFAPFIPKNNGSSYSEGAVTKKIVVPITSRPYDEPAAEKYASSGDELDDELHHQTIPVHSSPHKVVDQFPAKVQQNREGGRNPQRLGPIVDRGRHSPQPTTEGRKPIGISPIKNDKYDDTNGYGSDKGHKPIENSIKNGNYDSPKRYGGDHRAAVAADPNPYKEGRKPIGTGSIRSARDGYNGYGGDKEGRRPIESNIKNGNYEYDSPNRYSGDQRGAPVVRDPGLYKEGHKPIGGGSIRTSHDGYNGGYGGDKEGRRPIESNIKNGNYEYDSPNRYSGDQWGAPVVRDPSLYKEGHKPIGGGSIRTSHDGYNNGYGGDEEGRRPIESNIKNGNYEYDSPNRYSGDQRGAPVVRDPSLYKEGHKPIGGGSIRTSHDRYNSGYSGDKEGYKPDGGGNIQNDYYDSPNGYGGDYKEGHKPIGGGNIQNDYYDSPTGYGGGDYNKKEGYKPMRNGNYGNSYGNGPKISSDWSAAPRKGIQLSEPTHDIDKALELLKIEAAKRDHNQSNNDHHHYYDSPSPTATDNWGAPASGNGSPRFTDRTGSAGIMRSHGNVNQLPSRPRNSPINVTFVDDGRDYSDDDYYRRGDIGRYGYRDAVIDSREAEKKFKGTRV